MLVQAAWLAAPSTGSDNPVGLLLPFAVLILIFYFLLIRPQSRQRHKSQEMLASLKTGDRVVTNGGVLGTIVGFGSNTVQLQVTSQVKIEVLRSAIASLQQDEIGAAKKGSETVAAQEASGGGKERK
ncbi:MAG: preprotein translocase subunit YajC [Terriglobia bacterium]